MFPTTILKSFNLAAVNCDYINSKLPKKEIKTLFFFNADFIEIVDDGSNITGGERLCETRYSYQFSNLVILLLALKIKLKYVKCTQHPKLCLLM